MFSATNFVLKSKRNRKNTPFDLILIEKKEALGCIEKLKRKELFFYFKSHLN